MENNILVMSKEFKDMTAILGELQEKMKGVNEAFSEFSAFKDSTAVVRENIKFIGEELDVLKKPNIFDITVGLSSIGSFGIALAQVVKSTEKQMQNIAEVFENNDVIQKAVKNLGKDVANGISEGLKDGINVVKMSTTVICNDGILETIKDELQIKSPSKVMKRIGEYISEGLGDGIKDGGKHIKAAMGDATDIIEDSSKRMSKLQFGLGGLTAVTAIVVPLIDYFVNMMSTNETLSAKMEEIWVKICEAFKPVTDAVINLFNQFTTGSESSVSALDTVLAAVGVAAEVLAGVVEAIAGFFREYGDETKNIFQAKGFSEGDKGENLSLLIKLLAWYM